MAMGKLIFFPGAEDTLLQREDRLAGAHHLLDDIEALVEAQRGLCYDGAWRNARSYLLREQEMRIAALRELLGGA